MTTTQGFNFDVFISYRHNDNKAALGMTGDGWVTEFVNCLEAELETIVKGGARIYFDKDLHHGLRETDQVEASLAGRLNALILVPVLSQTYCDTESYAWKQEFVPFLENCRRDTLGATLKLNSGNVASRVLPVCIHELDSEDLALVESHLDGKLRSVPFVFKSAGVNRPLRAHEEDPLKNLNRTNYRDQINKLALAIKEMIESVRKPERPHAAAPKEEPHKASLLAGMMPPPPVVKSIAILPLVFKSQNPDEEFLSQGFAEDLYGSLKQVRALRLSILGLGAPVNGKAANGSPATAPATLVLSGSMMIQDNAFTIQIRLMDTARDAAVWEGEFKCTREELFHLRPRIIMEICNALKITLKETEKKTVLQDTATSARALELCWKGRYHWRRRGNDLITSLECFQKAAELDAHFAPAFAGIANAAVLLGYYDMIPFEEALATCRQAAMNALSIDPTLIEAYYALSFVALSYEWSWPEAEHNFFKVFDINPAGAGALKKFRLCQTQIFCNFEEAEIESAGTVPHFLHSYALLHKGKFEEGLKVAQSAIKKDPDSFLAQRAAGLCYLELGYDKEAIESLNTAAQLSNRHPWTLFDLIGAHATLAHNEAAQEIMEEATTQVNALLARINDYFFQPA